MNNSKTRHLKTLNKIPRIIFLLSIIATIISIIVLCSIPGNRETISCDYESFSNGWVTDNGSKADLSHITGKYMVHNTIPLLSHDSELFFLYTNRIPTQHACWEKLPVRLLYRSISIKNIPVIQSL